MDISAVAVSDRFALVAADEKASVQVLERTAAGFKRAGRPVPLLDGDGEADIEGIAIDRPSSSGPITVYAIGCHCQNRKRLQRERTLAQNRERLQKVDLEESRAHVFRLRLDAGTGAQDGQVERKSLMQFLEGHPVLGRFAAIPSKENGIDIEGLALGSEGKLYAGLRGPVLRDSFVPVVVFDFARPDDAEVRLVQLDGLGIRDLAAVKGGFLLLAGPVGEGPSDYRLFFWNGHDGIPGSDRSNPPGITELGEIPVPDPAAKPEGLAVLREDDGRFEVLVVYDGISGGRPTRLTVDKP